ncbi:enoyl-CoA hydratase/isomerase family protein [Pseudonocardia sp. N23]|uniref:enoyl-CoA hydratase/isomerase family protein n=1 Tax=Pseudonocardia sp. N23 TaxID=1987376 RepID=UPI000BFCDC5F|nr:enoyl-CoA hydratase/isomerase family protein [Pseudonocardia sp. N23]GAY10859.1 enoyl-CoA hydratase [Pseudonocardia sp. N23]
MTSFDTITFEVAEHVATITLNRPEALNAINTQMQLELKTAWDEVHFNDDIHAVLLTAAGDRAFCVGADRSDMGEVSTRRRTRVDDPSKAHLRGGVVPGAPGAESTLEMNVCPKSMGAWKPVITAVNGIACGGAFYMLGESDIIIAAEHATFFDPHVTFGMVAGYESVHMLQRMPLGEVLRMQLMGSRERLSAGRAHQIGLVSEVVPADRLHEAAWHVASTIAGYAPGAVQGTLRAIWAARELPKSVALQLSPQFIGMASLDDWAAGQRTFESGKRAEWRLR